MPLASGALHCTHVLSPVHSIDTDAQLSVNIKDTASTQVASFDVDADADADAGIGFISISASASALMSASASYCEPCFSAMWCACTPAEGLALLVYSFTQRFLVPIKWKTYR